MQIFLWDLAWEISVTKGSPLCKNYDFELFHVWHEIFKTKQETHEIKPFWGAVKRKNL